MKKSDLLSPFGFLYGAIVGVRRRLYQKGVFKSSDLGGVTISIGNITVGGTGKTPLVYFVARALAEKGEKVCVLTRGYKRQNERARVLVSDGAEITASVKQAGDEPFELAQKLLGISAVVADANRVGAGNWARRQLGITAFVLDDAFGHLKVKRFPDIVCVDATNPFGNRKLLPAGILREPLRNLKRADAIVITRANLVDEKKVADLKTEISKYNQKAKIFVSQNKITKLTDLKEFPTKARNGENESNSELQITNDLQRGAKDKGQRTKDKVLAFCALGNPENFFQQLRREGFNLVSERNFPDHHFYTQKDIDELEKAAQTNGAKVLLTTAKDAVKLAELKFALPCYVVETELVFDDEEGFRKLIVGVRPG